jgi:hypothetical protein
MLIRLSPEQIVSIWERIRPLALENLIPKVGRSPEVVFRVIQSLLTESLQLWAGIEDREGELIDRIYGFLATTIDIDAITQERNLLLYSIFSIKEIPISIWIPGLAILQQYKEENHCRKIIAYTDVPEIVALTKRLGFQQYTFVVKE